MQETRCRVCNRPAEGGPAGFNAVEWNLTFPSGVCLSCSRVLIRAFTGIVMLLRESHSERQERVIEDLTQRLEQQGFEVAGAFNAGG